MDSPSYSVDVRPIQEILAGHVEVDARLDLPPLVLGTETFAPAGPARLKLDVTNTGAGIVASGTVEVDYDVVCSRCLEPFSLPLVADVEGFFVIHGEEADLPDEQEYGFVEDGSIEIMPTILSALALEAPFAPLHDPECKGICPTCGADLNAGGCQCSPPETASPFAVLKALLPPDDEDE